MIWIYLFMELYVHVYFNGMGYRINVCIKFISFFDIANWILFLWQYVCAELGGTLAHMETQDESDFLENFVLNQGLIPLSSFSTSVVSFNILHCTDKYIFRVYNTVVYPRR